MSRTYRDIARIKAKNYGYKATNARLAGNYNLLDWNGGRRSDYRLHGMLRKEKSLKAEHDKEIDPYIYPIPYCAGMYFDGPDEEIWDEDWDLNDDWDDNAYDYPHRKRKRKTRKEHKRKDPYTWYRDWVAGKIAYYGDKPEGLKQYEVFEMAKPGTCIHEWQYEVFTDVEHCFKCSSMRYHK